MPDMEDDFIDGDSHDPYNPLDQDRVAKAELEAEETAAMGVRHTLERRQQAYRRVFAGLDSEDMSIVMEDLKYFCSGGNTVFHTNHAIHSLLTGRQEVWLRVEDHLRLDLDTLVLKYTAPRQPNGS